MRLIDADVIIKRIEKQRELLRPHIYESDAIGDAAYRGTEEIIEHFPTVDAVPVVRCRDCTHKRDSEEEFDWDGTPLCRCAYSKMPNRGWEYCSWGEREEVSE